jgi:hypothetical protein
VCVFVLGLKFIHNLVLKISWFGLGWLLLYRGGWPHYTDTSKPVDGGVGTVQL